MTKSRKLAAYSVIVFFFTIISSPSRAQDDDGDVLPRTFYAGLIGGINMTQVDGDYYAGYRKPGLNVGAISYVKLKPHLALSMELLYSQKGAKSDLSRPFAKDSAIITRYRLNLNYAEIPVMINYFDQRKSHAGIGISYSRLIGATESMTTDPALNPDFSKYPFKKQDIQAVAGAQLHVWKGLFLNIRFQYSLVPARSDIPVGFARAKQYNNLWTVRLMYLFI